jgi:hypothetical protein
MDWFFMSLVRLGPYRYYLAGLILLYIAIRGTTESLVVWLLMPILVAFFMFPKKIMSHSVSSHKLPRKDNVVTKNPEVLHSWPGSYDVKWIFIPIGLAFVAIAFAASYLRSPWVYLCVVVGLALLLPLILLAYRNQQDSSVQVVDGRLLLTSSLKSVWSIELARIRRVSLFKHNLMWYSGTPWGDPTIFFILIEADICRQLRLGIPSHAEDDAETIYRNVFETLVQRL